MNNNSFLLWDLLSTHYLLRISWIRRKNRTTAPRCVAVYERSWGYWQKEEICHECLGAWKVIVDFVIYKIPTRWWQSTYIVTWTVSVLLSCQEIRTEDVSIVTTHHLILTFKCCCKCSRYFYKLLLLYDICTIYYSRSLMQTASHSDQTFMK